MSVMNLRRLSSAGLGALVVLGSVVPAFAQTAPDAKIDRALRAGLRSGAPTQSVIITVTPGYRGTLRDALQQHGDRIKAEHPLIEALTADIHSEDITELSKQPWVLSVAVDAVVSAKDTQTSSALQTLRPTLGLPAVPTSTSMTGATGVAVA